MYPIHTDTSRTIYSQSKFITELLFKYLDGKGIDHNFDPQYKGYFCLERFDAVTVALQTHTKKSKNKKQKQEDHGSGQSDQDVTTVDSGSTASFLTLPCTVMPLILPAKSNSMITTGTTIIANGSYTIVKKDKF